MALANILAPHALPAHSSLLLCPRAQGPALTVEAHIVVRQDGRAIPLG